jgi:hypothetical protein
VDVLKGDGVLPDARRLVRHVASKLPGAYREPALLSVLRTSTMEVRSEVLLRGKRALATAEPFAGVLALEGFTLAGAARYARGGRITRMLVADFDDEASAGSALEALARRLGSDVRADLVSVRRDEASVLAWREGPRVRLLVRPDP